MLSYSFTVQAEENFLHISNYFATENPALATRFIDAVETSCEMIVEHPEIERTVDFIHQQSIRRLRIKGFQRYVLFYRLSEQKIEVIRMCHGSGDLPALFQV